MALVSRSCIEGIKDRVNIHDVVAPYVALKRSGASWKGLSPFNSEKTPSFYVLPEKNIFKCFSSGYAGDIFRFLQLKENLSFNEAIESIAHRFNVPLEYEEGSGTPQESTSLKKEIFDMHEHACNFFHQCFLGETKSGAFIRNYWTKDRNFSMEVAKEHKIGLAPPESNALMGYLLKKQKFSLEALHKSGLFFARDYEKDPRRFMSRFRGRLMIPIRDVQGRVIAFAGRQLTITPEDDPAKEAKYINSPETPIFHKGRTLFGLDRARTHIDENGHFILVEGQLDALRCWEKGLNTAIAPQGTGITEQQLSTMRRYCSKLYCVLDPDSAGQKAALRILPLAMKAGLEISFVNLPEGSDPDTFLSKEGKDSFIEEVNKATSPMEFTVNAFLPSATPSPREKAQVLGHIFEIIAICDSAVVQEEYLLEICHLMKVNRQSVQQDFNQFKRTKKRVNNGNLEQKVQRNANEKLTSVEYQLLLIILNEENISFSLANIINPEWITTDSLEGKILLRILAEIREHLWQGVQGLDAVLESDAERNLAYSILSESHPFEEPVKTTNICLKQLFTNFLNDRKNQIDNKIANTPTDNVDIIRKLQQERIELRKLNQTPPIMELVLETQTI